MRNARADSHLRGLDQLTEQVIASVEPLSLEIVESAADLDAVYRMRYQCVVEQGWADPEDFPDGRERDPSDPVATTIVCRDGDAIAGTVRMIPPDAEGVLPSEKDFGFRLEPPGRAVESGRLVIGSDYRGGAGHPVLAGLFSRCWLEARRAGYDRVIALIPSKLIAVYRGLGVRVIELAPPRMHWGQERTPVEIDGAEDTFAAVRKPETAAQPARR
jgi:N-acyl-L-homoserine lactone synthetase